MQPKHPLCKFLRTVNCLCSNSSFEDNSESEEHENTNKHLKCPVKSEGNTKELNQIAINFCISMAFTRFH